jgi:hypothetical protein
MKKLSFLVLAALLWPGHVNAQSVQQSGSVTRGHLPYWVQSGIIGDGGTAADSPITSIGATGSICSNSARSSSGAWINLCLGYNSGVPTISVQNNGTATAQPLQFVINGTTYAFPGSLADITIGTTSVVGGTTGQCLYVSGSVVGQQTCTLSAITSLTGDVTATGPGVSAATLATVNANTGTWGSGTLIPVFTVNGKGLITSASNVALALTIGSTTVASGSTNGLLYNNGGLLGNLGTLASGVLITSAGGVPSIATTLPSGLTVPSPTFTGTMTMPDASTWAAAGLGRVAALGVGSRNAPSAGNLDISGQYQISGTQIAASNLSNGTTGSGAVVLAASPAISGTWTGSPTFSGNITYSGQLIGTGTSAPSSAAGNTVLMGTIASPTLSNNGQAFLYNTVVNGAILEGAGSTNDVSLFNKSGALVFGVPTGTTKLNFPSLSAGTCSSGLGLDSGNNTILVSCPGAASSIQVGTTQVNSSTASNYILTTGSVSGGTGTLANVLVSTGLAISSTTLTNTGVVTVKVQKFTANGTYTPSTGMIYAIGECIGGGGAGGGALSGSNVAFAGGGGAGGTYSRILLTAASVGASKAITIGTGGAGSSNAAGAAGTTTSIGTLCTAPGGGGGAVSNPSSGASGVAVGGTPGATGTGDYSISGSPGGTGGFNNSGAASGVVYPSGPGGAAGNGAGGGVSVSAVGTALNGTAAAANSGAGGSGASHQNTGTGGVSGGAGGSGVVFITEFNTQ